MEPIKVLIADDHAMVREGLSTALQTTSTIRVVGMAANGREAIEKVKTLKPCMFRDRHHRHATGSEGAVLLQGLVDNYFSHIA